MTEANRLNHLKLLAKRYARANRVSLHQALDFLAEKLGFSSWTKLVSASKKDWIASPEQMASVEALVEETLPANFQIGNREAMAHRFAYLDNAEQGVIGQHAYRLQVALHDVIMAGDGWSITVPENPAARPVVQTVTNEEGKYPVFEPEFFQEALSLVKDRAAKVRGEISMDWPRRSTKPNQDGVVRHPLWGRESDVWFCLRCNGKITGFQIAQNLWHCPGCGASPLDIFDTAFWCEDEGRSLSPVKLVGAADNEKPDFRVVDDRLKPELNDEKITLLIRSALLDDATNVSEKLGALQAEITVDEDDDVWISFNEDLWPYDKQPTQALIVAAQLGIEIELESIWSTLPFHWPGLGELTSSTSEYTKILLEAYSQYASSSKERD